jgi:hypothetical protein
VTAEAEIVRRADGASAKVNDRIDALEHSASVSAGRRSRTGDPGVSGEYLASP